MVQFFCLCSYNSGAVETIRSFCLFILFVVVVVIVVVIIVFLLGMVSPLFSDPSGAAAAPRVDAAAVHPGRFGGILPPFAGCARPWLPTARWHCVGACATARPVVGRASSSPQPARRFRAVLSRFKSLTAAASSPPLRQEVCVPWTRRELVQPLARARHHRLDRLMALLCGAPNIRDVIAFPKSTAGNELMTGGACRIMLMTFVPDTLRRTAQIRSVAC